MKRRREKCLIQNPKAVTASTSVAARYRAKMANVSNIVDRKENWILKWCLHAHKGFMLYVFQTQM